MNLMERILKSPPRLARVVRHGKLKIPLQKVRKTSRLNQRMKRTLRAQLPRKRKRSVQQTRRRRQLLLVQHRRSPRRGERMANQRRLLRLQQQPEGRASLMLNKLGSLKRVARKSRQSR